MQGRLTLRALFLVAAALLLPVSAAAEGIKAMRPGDVLRGHFVQERFLQGFAAPLKSEGTFVLAPDNGLIWRAEKPFANTTLMTSSGMAQQTDGATTMDLPASRAPFLAGLYGMLSGALAGQWQALEQDFTVMKTEADGAWTLQLTPKKAVNDAMPIAQITISGKDYVERVDILKQGGDHDTLTFHDQQLTADPLDAADAALLKAVGHP